MNKQFWIVTLAVVMGLFTVPGLRAQQNAPSGPANTSPGVARISYINGEVSTLRGAAGTWVAAILNAPLVVGDKVSTGDNSRAEVELNYANVLRLGGRTEASIANLSNQQIQVQVAQGLVDYWVSKDNQANLEIDTPNVAVHPLNPGLYRIEVDSASYTKVTVRKGRAQVSTPQGSADLKEHEMMEVQGTENPQYQVVDAPGQDSWDQWNDQRDNLIANAQSWQYDNQYYTGTEDLDAYGHWEYVPGYDWCWTPYIDDGWVPYSAGEWTYEPFYGWTWVSYEPWGWAPYHYGRWFFYNSAWMWWPGPISTFYHPIWAPAYVSFFGFGGGFGFGLGFGFGFGFGRIGWLPIGPADPFFPWYGAGRFGYRMTNFADIANFRYGNMPYFRPLAGGGRPAFSNFRAALTNARVRQGFVNMPANEFGRGAVGQFGRAGASEAEFRQASFVSGHVPIAPSRDSLNFANRAVSRASLPSASVNNRQMFSVQRPAAAQRSFSEQAANMRQMIQNNRSTSTQAGSRSSERGGQSYSQGARGFSNGASNRGQAQSGASWRRFSSTPQERSQDRSSFSSRSAGSSGNSGSRDGWSGFGSSRSGGTPSSGRWQGSSQGSNRASGQSGQSWSRFSPQARESFDRSSGGFSSGEKPSLDINRPIVSGRSGGGSNYRGSWSNGYYRPSTKSSSSGSQRGSSRPSGGYGGGGSAHGGGGGGGHASGGGHGGGHGGGGRR